MCFSIITFCKLFQLTTDLGETYSEFARTMADYNQYLFYHKQRGWEGKPMNKEEFDAQRPVRLPQES